MSKADEFFAYVDVETTGIEVDEHLLLEVGIAIVTRDFDIVDMRSRVVQHSERDLNTVPITGFVHDMHSANNLWHEVQSVTGARLPFEVEGDMLNFMHDWFGDEKPPMAGSSLAMDRSFIRAYMPQLDEAFHYRSIDNSTVKELCRRLNPELYAKLPVFETDHRVRTCLTGTVAEAKFYADNFFFQNWDWRA